VPSGEGSRWFGFGAMLAAIFSGKKEAEAPLERFNVLGGATNACSV
jgi:hypothetical protein